MNGNEIENYFQNRCRACGCRRDGKKLNDIHSMSTIAEGKSIVDLLIDCSGLAILLDDPYPQQICSKCMRQLSGAYEFRKLCRATDRAFQTHLIEQKQSETIIRNNYPKVRLLNILPNYNFQSAGTKFKLNQTKLINLDPLPYDNSVDDETDCGFDTIFTDDNVTAEDLLDNVKVEIKEEQDDTQFSPKSEVDDSKCFGDPKQTESIETGHVPSVCSLCPFQTYTPDKLQQHFLSHYDGVKNSRISDAATTITKIIDSGLTKRGTPRINRKYEVDGAKNFTIHCFICKTIFNSKDELFKHLDYTYSAQVAKKCKQKFYDSRYVKVKKQYKFTCDICSKTFTYKQRILEHLRIHTGEKPHVCEICGRRFAQIATYKSHMTVHTGARLHLCTECGKRFNTPALLRRHTVVHTGEKQFLCDFCPASYTTKSYLVTHVKRNHSEKQYKCNVCGKDFSLAGHLTKHMDLHNGYPFCCSLCEQRFKIRRLLQNHLFEIHNITVDLAVIQRNIPVKLDSTVTKSE